MTQKMHTLNDEYSGRPVTADAWKALSGFREASAVAFHNYGYDEVRELYVKSCTANGLEESETLRHVDFDVKDFRVRLYDPRPESDRNDETPAVLFIHGGGWLMGNLETHHSAARRIALETRFPVVAVDYRLAPEHLYPAAHDDCRDALRWLSDSNAEHGLNVSNISLVGDSAGGQLVAFLANEFTGDDSVAPISSQVLIYPVVDLTEERLSKGASYQRVTEGFPLVADTMRWFIDTYLPEGQDRSTADLSPLLAELPENLPPAIVLTMDNDPLADEGGEYAAKLAQAGVEVIYKHLRGYHHGLFTSAGVMARGEAELSNISKFIIEHARSSEEDL
ncbi:Esterase/lipase [Corynebacterium camporealensis]|uniref:Esterase/lipase n=1 Tax=Corynebacterium camporealensis TaxID=161896 RepID=A0A0F6QVR1_9CORY|nr:alpha/beta hydrolase [Corynebacterium camporealensis]AKE38525.1 esterase/lipase [Corynebacterium camporealensis]AVH87823.1 Esterase/lipase [Corynebacterium camporealensis]